MDQPHRVRASRHASRLIIPLLLACAGVGIASAVVWRASNAAFTATTNNGVNSWSTGSVALVDNDSSALLFNVSNMVPGQTAQRCIRVTYNGSVTSSVKLYSPSGSDPGNLGSLIDITIERGTDSGVPAFGDCTNFITGATIYATNTLANFRASNTSFATGIDSWAPTGSGQTRDYRFTYTFSAAATDAEQGKTATATFTWEAQA